MKSRLFFSILFVWVTFAGEEWTEVAYFQRKEAKMRIHIYDPPIVMEWLQVPNNIPKELSEKLKTIVAKPYIAHDSFESWKKYTTSDVLNDSVRFWRNGNSITIINRISRTLYGRRKKPVFCSGGSDFSPLFLKHLCLGV